jgi:hypothetical protein
MRAFLLSILAALAVMFTPVSASAQDMMRFNSVADGMELLRSEGYGSVEIENENAVSFRYEGSTYLLYIYDDGDIQLYYGVTGVSPSLSKINEWNRDFRLSRAYIDREGDPILESDLLADKGVTRTQVRNFFSVFFMLQDSFVDHIQE